MSVKRERAELMMRRAEGHPVVNIQLEDWKAFLGYQVMGVKMLCRSADGAGVPVPLAYCHGPCGESLSGCGPGSAGELGFRYLLRRLFLPHPDGSTS